MSLTRRSILGGLLGLVAAPVTAASMTRTPDPPAPPATPPAKLTEPTPPEPALLHWSGATWAAAHAFMQAYRVRSIYPDMSGSDIAEALARASREAIEEGTRMLEDPAYAWLDGATT